MTAEYWLITGGAGYIGSHISQLFLDAGKSVVIVDKVSKNKIDHFKDLDFRCFDMLDTPKLMALFQEYNFSGVIHAAAYKHARESMLYPFKYWNNNVGATLSLAKVLEINPVPKVILSSSCSVYGSAGHIVSDTQTNPVSPYGATKLASEEILLSVSKLIGSKYRSLRYFNVVGNVNNPGMIDASAECLLPVLARAHLAGKEFKIFGSSFTTLDGTAVRDYVDVRDLANAHLVVANSEMSSDNPHSINVSTGSPVSVMQMVNYLQEVSGIPVRYSFEGANNADPSAIWADRSTILTQLGWAPQYGIIDSIDSYWSLLPSSPDGF